MTHELEDLEAEYKASSDLFEKQKEEAMATMKKSEDLKCLWNEEYEMMRSQVFGFFAEVLSSCRLLCFTPRKSLGKLKDKTGYKIAILEAKSAKTEL